MQKSNASSSDETVYLWWVPLNYTAVFQTNGSTWLVENQSSKKLELSIPVNKNQRLIFNVDEKGIGNVGCSSVIDHFDLMAINCR